MAEIQAPTPDVQPDFAFWPSLKDTDFFQAVLARTRKLLNLSQAELADGLGLNRRTVIRWEAGTHYPESPREFGRVLEPFVADSLQKRFAARYRIAMRHAKRKGEPALDDVVHPNKAKRLAFAYLGGGRAAMRLSTWGFALNLGPSLFADLPVAGVEHGEPMYWGYDVGFAIDALLTGETFEQRTTHSDGTSARTFSLALDLAEQRLLNEIEYHLHGVEWAITIGVVTHWARKENRVEKPGTNGGKRSRS